MMPNNKSFEKRLRKIREAYPKFLFEAYDSTEDDSIYIASDAIIVLSEKFINKVIKLGFKDNELFYFDPCFDFSLKKILGFWEHSPLNISTLPSCKSLSLRDFLLPSPSDAIVSRASSSSHHSQVFSFLHAPDEHWKGFAETPLHCSHDVSSNEQAKLVA